MDELLIIVKRVTDAVKSDKIRRIALSTTLAVQKPRIFNNGENERGGQIGKYSKKYGEYKTKIGKNPGYVNFRNTDQLMNDYGIIAQGDQYAFGFQNSANAEKPGHLMERYGDVFHVSGRELDVFGEVLNNEINKA